MQVGISALIAAALIAAFLAVRRLRKSRKADLYVPSHSKFTPVADPDHYLSQHVSRDCLQWISQEEGKRGLQ